MAYVTKDKDLIHVSDEVGRQNRSSVIDALTKTDIAELKIILSNFFMEHSELLTRSEKGTLENVLNRENSSSFAYRFFEIIEPREGWPNALYNVLIATGHRVLASKLSGKQVDEMKKAKNLDSCVSDELGYKLIKILRMLDNDQNSTVSDWRSFCSHFEIGSQTMDRIQGDTKHDSPMEKVMGFLRVNKPKLTLRTVVKVLNDMGRNDVLESLRQAYGDDVIIYRPTVSDNTRSPFSSMASTSMSGRSIEPPSEYPLPRPLHVRRNNLDEESRVDNNFPDTISTQRNIPSDGDDDASRSLKAAPLPRPVAPVARINSDDLDLGTMMMPNADSEYQNVMQDDVTNNMHNFFKMVDDENQRPTHGDLLPSHHAADNGATQARENLMQADPLREMQNTINPQPMARNPITPSQISCVKKARDDLMQADSNREHQSTIDLPARNQTSRMSAEVDDSCSESRSSDSVISSVSQGQSLATTLNPGSNVSNTAYDSRAPVPLHTQNLSIDSGYQRFSQPDENSAPTSISSLKGGYESGAYLEVTAGNTNQNNSGSNPNEAPGSDQPPRDQSPVMYIIIGGIAGAAVAVVATLAILKFMK